MFQRVFRSVLAPTLLVPCALVGSAAAQLPSVYVDLSDSNGSFGVPSNTFAGAASMPGTWNGIDVALITTNPYVSMPLVDIAGATTGVTLSADGASATLLAFNFDEPNTMGDDEALIDDLGYFAGPGTFTFSGLPAGTYDVITYAMAPDGNMFFTTVDVVGSTSGVQTIGGDFTLGYALGVTHAMHEVTVAAGGDIVIETDVGSTTDSINGFQIIGDQAGPGIGANYCMAAANSTGNPGTINALGSTTASDNDLTLLASDLPSNQFGIFLTSMTQAFSPGASGTSNGNLCLGGSIGRFSQPSQTQSTGTSGVITLGIDLTTIPQGSSFVAVAAGETWNFQAWHRDVVGLGSNFTDGLEIDFD